MSALAQLTIHETQFPAKVRQDLLQSLRSRKINHKFHYDSLKQTQKWLDLHQKYSPSRSDPDCRRIYDECFKASVRRISNRRVHLIGLGCGGGQKDSRILKLLQHAGKHPLYSPVDVSTAMVLTARQAAAKIVPEEHCFPLVCDLAETNDLETALTPPKSSRHSARIVTFFGMMPNFEQESILPKLAFLLGPNDLLLLSANLAPGAGYATGIKKVLPLYDNPLTRDWLMSFLTDLGVEKADGEIHFSIEDSNTALKRIVATWIFHVARTIEIDSKAFRFKPGTSIRLFFSYRHTPALLEKLLIKHGLRITSQWITRSQEEGVFLIEFAKPLLGRKTPRAELPSM
jgi:L-histidine N-alpha-methyltransferase